MPMTAAKFQEIGRAVIALSILSSNKLLQKPQVPVVNAAVLKMLDRAVEIFGHRSSLANRNSERIGDYVSG